MRRCFWMGVLTLCLTFPGFVSAQIALPADDTPSRLGISREEIETHNRELAKAQSLRLAKQRAEQMKRDSEQLVELANQIKQAVDKAGKDVLSIDVVRKAEAMEKLARRIRENMVAQ